MTSVFRVRPRDHPHWAVVAGEGRDQRLLRGGGLARDVEDFDRAIARARRDALDDAMNESRGVGEEGQIDAIVVRRSAGIWWGLIN